MTPPVPAATRRFSAQEFLAWERVQEGKHEWFDGEVFAMAGGSLRHNQLGAAVSAELRGALRGHPCRVLSSDQRIVARPGKHFVYADVTVVCSPPVLEPGTTDVLANPSVLVEVLSPSTEPYDRGLKWTGYQQIGSLEDYLLVSQTQARIEHFQRESDGSWRYRSAGAGERVTLKRGVVIEVDAVFAGAFELQGE